MGSLRRGLSAASLWLLASPALAEVCETHRPDWSSQDGPVSGLGEALHLFTSLPGLAILGAFVLALTRGRPLDWLLASFLPVVVGAALAYGATGEITLAMQQEGCAGPAGLSVTICILLALAAVFQSLRLRRSRGDG